MINRRLFLGGLLTTAFACAATDTAVAGPTTRMRTAVCVIGGGVGGVAAALSACSRGRNVILVEESMLGGQFTSQLVPEDGHYWIEDHAGGHGSSAAYRDLRERVRESYRRYRPVTDAFKVSREADPGNSWVSRLTAEPMVWRNRIHDLLYPYVNSGRLKVLDGYAPIGAAVVPGANGQRHINKVSVRNAHGHKVTIEARMWIDASELGDLLPVVGADYTLGREGNLASGREEMWNPSPDADPYDQQSFTHVAAVGYDPDGDHRMPDVPAGYSTHKPGFDAFFTKHLFDPTRDWSWDEAIAAGYREGNFWQYRRVIAQSQFTVPIEEVTLLNYAANDYKDRPLIDPETDTPDRSALTAAKGLTACLVYYLQHDIPNYGQTHLYGYPGIRLRPDISGSADGFADRPYVREARRIVSIGRVWAWHVGVEAREDHRQAAQFGDSVGTGHYWLDIHGGPKSGGLWRACYPYQVPLMALIPRNVDNLLAGGKCLGVSHVVNGAYRLHPTEWEVGQSAGMVAHCAIAWGETPKHIRNTPARLAKLQTNLTRAYGTQLEWPDHIKGAWNG